MSLQRLYQLDRTFAAELDELLHDEGYVGGLLWLPEDELIELVNYLNDVGFPYEINLANDCFHRPSTVGPTLAYHPENVYMCCGRYVALEKFSPPPSTYPVPFYFLSKSPLRKVDPATRTRALSVRRYASKNFGCTQRAIRTQPKRYLTCVFSI